MELKELVLGSGGALILLLTLLQIAPIKIDPWSALAKALGRAINADVLASLEEVRATQKRHEERMDDHIKVDDEREADRHRERILRFNNELFRGIPHEREDFIEILAVIDWYETYCREHKEYRFNRAVHAIANIGRVYDERLKKRDFNME